MIDLRGERIGRARVVDHEVGAAALAVEGALGGLALEDLGLRQSEALLGPGESHLVGGRDEPKGVAAALEADFDEQGHVEDEDRRTLPGAVVFDGVVDGGEHGGMREPFEGPQGPGLVEDLLGDGLPVGQAVLADGLRPQGLREATVLRALRQRGAGQRVGVEHLAGAERGDEPGDGGLARGDATEETDDQARVLDGCVHGVSRVRRVEGGGPNGTVDRPWGRSSRVPWVVGSTIAGGAGRPGSLRHDRDFTRGGGSRP